jgi:hypothetical protein
MNKFWEWMSHNKYGSFIKEYGSFIKDDSNGFVLYFKDNSVYFDFKDPPKLMIVGYMIEYINQHDWWGKQKTLRGFQNIQSMTLETKLHCIIFNDRHAYDTLKDVIEEIDR